MDKPKQTEYDNLDCNLIFNRKGFPESLEIMFRPEISAELKELYAKRNIKKVVVIWD